MPDVIPTRQAQAGFFGQAAGRDELARILNSRPSATMTKAPFVAPSASHQLPMLRAYVDETGDRGMFKGNASPIFGMAGVIVDVNSEVAARAALRQLRTEFRVPDDKPMSWKEHVKGHDRRVHAATVLADLKGVTLVYVVADKQALSSGTYKDDITLFYNVIAYETLKRILWTAAHGRVVRHQVEVRFGHVKKHDPTDTHNYFQIKKRQDGAKVPFDLMTHLGWVDATQYEMSQLADLYAGFLKAATWPNDWGDVEGAYLTRIWHQIRNSHRCILSLGLQYRPSNDLVRAMPWWPCASCTSTY
ncbi:DUF3800 domain-containing protein [Cellulosimicrobium aquatile]|uniref:DUF3800 domain-containing protein n=1 Tax=Cellulosimicrobium aquatile TaxID=1612203 RepID=UPI001980F47B